METSRKPGRPAKLGVPMTDKQRAAAYRTRLYESALVAHKDPKGATTTVLLACLKQHFSNIDTQPDHADIARRLAKPVMQELCERYDI